MANGIVTGLVTCPSDTDNDVSTVTTGFPTSLIFFVGVNQDGDGWEVNTQVVASMSLGACSRQASGAPRNMCWMNKFNNTGGEGTGVYDDRCFQTFDANGVDASPQCRGQVVDLTSDGFDFRWTRAKSGRRVFFIAVSQAGVTSALQQSSYGTINIGEPATLAMLFINGLLNSNSNVNPSGGFLWACLETGVPARGNGFTEFSFVDQPLSQQAHAWAWPSIVNVNQILPVYKPWLFGLLLGDWQYSYDDPDGWRFPIPGEANPVVAFAAAVAADQVRQRSVGTSSSISWGDTFTPEAYLLCCPSNGQGWTQSDPGDAADLRRGTGFGIDSKDGSLTVSLGVGRRSTDGKPYSWLLTDRSWLSDVDRAAPSTGLQAGTITTTPGETTFAVDDSAGTEDAIGLLAFGPIGKPLVSLSAVKMAQHGDVNKVKG